jgi:hypothetical protein
VKTLIACLVLHASATILLAQDLVFKSTNSATSLIELYSSEGCSSCPPAETWMNNLKTAPGLWKDIFPVSFHVDYWDNLGWPDRFASVAYTDRQRDYASRLGQGSIYTPEFIVNGREWQGNSLAGQTIPAMGAQKSGLLTLTVNVKEKQISAEFAPAGAAPTQVLTLNVALLGFNIVTDVKRGENAGQKLKHDFVVLGFNSSPLKADANGGYQDAAIALGSSTDDVPGAIVAWVSKEDGSILQVTGGWLSSVGHGGK